MLPNGIHTLRHYFPDVDRALLSTKRQKFRAYPLANIYLPVTNAEKIGSLLSKLESKIKDKPNHTQAQKRTGTPLTRSVLLIEIMAAAERIAEEFDMEIARMCALGNQTASIEDAHLMEDICTRASGLSRARHQILSLHLDLNNILLSLPDRPHMLPANCHFNFDLLAKRNSETLFVINSFLKAIEISINSLSAIGAELLKDGEFERLGEICEINIRLMRFNREMKMTGKQLSQSLPPSPNFK